MTEIIIDSYLCSGCETCAQMCPDVFRVDPVTEKAELLDIAPVLTDEIYLTAAFCPEKCIEIIE